MRVTGRVLDIERKHGNFKDRSTGDPVAYDFTLLHILSGRDVAIVRLPSEVNALDLPFGKDDECDLLVSVPIGTKTMYVGPA